MWQNLSTHSKGLTLVGLSALLFSTPGLFTRGVSASGWDVIFWRAVFSVMFTAAYLTWRGTLKSQILNLGVIGWANALIWASGTIAFCKPTNSLPSPMCLWSMAVHQSSPHFWLGCGFVNGHATSYWPPVFWPWRESLSLVRDHWAHCTWGATCWLCGCRAQWPLVFPFSENFRKPRRQAQHCCPLCWSFPSPDLGRASRHALFRDSDPVALRVGLLHCRNSVERGFKTFTLQ